ncbi:hypothetical protein [Jannaschia sp. M317]|uniref:hypothetical protein n=1 Tax=Jannaschia sp. M317 TaxID=2867011 RepID=UPI0028830DF6|nr:hypothetical protein [Jannaschia sp. M317]
MEAELDLHGLVYEHANNRILENTWTGLRGHLRLYWPRTVAHTGPVCQSVKAMMITYILPWGMT